MHKFENGKFQYGSYATIDGQNMKFVIELDLSDPEIRDMLYAAAKSKGHKSVRANGALKITVGSNAAIA